jgi:cell division protein FtsI/penicillin-binding protein 2
MQMGDPVKIFDTLKAVIPLDRADFLARAKKTDDPYEVIAEEVNDATAERVRKLKLSSVSIEPEQWRRYPGGGLLAHTIGFVGFEGSDFTGRYGLEKYYEPVLSRAEGISYTHLFAKFFSDIKNPAGGGVSGKPGDLVLTIEPTVQTSLESELEAIQKTWEAKAVGGIVIDPKTGAIAALAAFPAFSPENYSKEKDVAIFVNPLVERVFEMGSVFKPLVVAIGLDTGAVTADTQYYDTGSVEIDGATIKNFDGKGRGLINVQTILGKSLNTGMTFIAGKIGQQNLKDYLLNYGLGEKTGIDLPYEAYGLLGNLSSGREVEYATAAFGQGIALTPVGLVRALGSLGNGGVLMKPYIVKEIHYDDGTKEEIRPIEQGRVLKKTTSEEISRILVRVVDEDLLNGTVKLPHYTIAAKTGTAQILNPETGKYYDDRNLHSFFGYFPAYNPRFLIFLFALEPHNVAYASQSLTPPFMNLVKFLINYYEIPPDR